MTSKVRGIYRTFASCMATCALLFFCLHNDPAALFFAGVTFGMVVGDIAAPFVVEEDEADDRVDAAMMGTLDKRKEQGFTLIELIIVMVLCFILLAIVGGGGYAGYRYYQHTHAVTGHN